MISSTQPSAVFRCDASIDIGAGHVMRCLTIAHELRTRGWHCSFLTIEGTKTLIPSLSASGFEILSPETTPDSTNFLIVDHYGLSDAYEMNARQWANKIMVIDDFANRAHDCDLLLDQTYGRKPEEYKKFTPDHCKELCGKDYILLRPQFLEAKETAQERRKNIKRAEKIFVSFGATNPNNITQKVLNALSEFKKWPLTIVIAMGAKAQNIEEIRNLIKTIEADTQHQVHLHLDAQNMTALMTQSDLSIGGGGTMSWERACVGLPTLMIELVDNQRAIAQNLNELGAIKLIGALETVQEADIDKAFEIVRDNSDLLAEMSQKSFSICDGLGVKRVCDAIEKTAGARS